MASRIAVASSSFKALGASRLSFSTAAAASTPASAPSSSEIPVAAPAPTFQSAVSQSAQNLHGLSKPPTAIVMMNMGGPPNLQEVGPFLHRLFADREIIQLPFQSYLGPFIANKRTPKVAKHYADIGGGSPILKWSRIQGEGMIQHLDALSPETGPHRAYVCFRYAPPLTETCLQEMKADGIERAVAFTQYPHWSCTTTGASLNELWRQVKKHDLQDKIQWSVVDRWPLHSTFIQALSRRVRLGLDQFENQEDKDSAVIVFSAHSLPISVVERGDPYPAEIAATAAAVMRDLGFSNQYQVSYQSAVGPVKWLGPMTENVIAGLGKRGRKNVLVVPIAFTSDHIETLYEIDMLFAEDARKAGVTNYKRAPSLNDEPLLQRALAEIAAAHLRGGGAGGDLGSAMAAADKQPSPCSRQYSLRCPDCVNPDCRNIVNPAWPYTQPPVGKK